MCLGIPARLVELPVGESAIAVVDLGGARRAVNVALVADEGLVEGDFLLIHVGFAIAKMESDEAARTIADLEALGGPYRDELEAMNRGSSR
ncbi:MAG: HypC/HybG/HupF family hydrogenase formation chaperone [Actinomycetota bacterium]|nr:HypC/HybG/HupF family hydrogenase formation chaperone [Actinomycetota bacterium]